MTFSAIIQRAVERGGRVALLVHRVELIRQASRSLSALGVEHGVIAPRWAESAAPVQIASVASLVRRLDRYEPDAFSLIVIDEAHHAVAGQWSRCLEHFSGAMRLGVTATPIRLDGRGLSERFDRLVVGPSAEWLTMGGHLAPAKVYAPPVGFSAAGLKRRGGEFAMEEAGRQLQVRSVMGDVISHYRAHLDGETAIAFCCSIAHAEAVAEAFRVAGVPAASIDGTMTEDRRELLLAELAVGRLRVLTSCMLIGEGVDVPSVGGAILLRPTMSLGLFLQMVGRCLRPSPGKAHAVVLDHVGNYERHGHHLDPREWQLVEGVRRREGRDTGPSLWVCPRCYATNDSRSRECVECRHVKPKTEAELKQIQGELEEYERRQRRLSQSQASSFHDLVALGRARGMKHPWSWAQHVWTARQRRGRRSSVG